MDTPPLERGLRPDMTVADFLSEFCNVGSDGRRRLINKAYHGVCRIVEFADRLEASVKVEGHEELLIKRLEKHPSFADVRQSPLADHSMPLIVRLIALSLRRCGVQWVAERHDSRSLASLIGWLAKGSGKGSLAISSRALEMLSLIRNSYGQMALRSVLEISSAAPSLGKVERLLERAANKEGGACRLLVRYCRHLSSRVRRNGDPRGCVGLSKRFGDWWNVHIFGRAQ
jgi:hypothetical protein